MKNYYQLLKRLTKMKSQISIMDAYVFFCKKILTEGVHIYKDDNDSILETLGNFAVINDPVNLKYKIKYQDYKAENLLFDINNAKFDMVSNPVKSDALFQYVNGLKNHNLNGFVYTYPNRIYEHFHTNQYDVMKNRLLNNLGSNRAIAIIYDPANDGEIKDIPCLQIIQAIIRNNNLSLHCYFRSNDMFGAFYSNMFLLTYIGLKLKDDINKEMINVKLGFDGIYYHSSSSHIYNSDKRAAKKMVKYNEKNK